MKNIRFHKICCFFFKSQSAIPIIYEKSYPSIMKLDKESDVKPK